MKYLATYVPERFFEGFQIGKRYFDLPTDQEAIMYAENPESHAKPFRFVLPSGDGTCKARISKLVELSEPPRVVKEW